MRRICRGSPGGTRLGTRKSDDYRHCERSEAIQLGRSKESKLDCFVAIAPRNDGEREAYKSDNVSSSCRRTSSRRTTSVSPVPRTPRAFARWSFCVKLRVAPAQLA